MNDNLVEIVAVVDRSGSMAPLKNDAIGGFNSFLEAQKSLPGQANFTLALFNHNYKLIYDGVDIAKVAPLDTSTYVPGGMTALLDAVGRTIDAIGVRLNSMPEAERPRKVIFCILTDGEENNSTEYNLEQVKEMIKHQQEGYDWSFLFLASGLDAFMAGQNLGLGQYTTQYAQTAAGAADSYAYMTRSVTNLRADDGNT